MTEPTDPADPTEPRPEDPEPPDTAFDSPPATTRLPQGLRAFRHYNFRLFWFGMLVSLIGNWMQIVGQGWLVLELTGDPVALGLIAAAQWTPILFLGLFGGIVADAVNKRRALLVTQAAAGCLALILGVLVATSSVQVWQVFTLAITLGIVNAFDMPIRQSFVVEMVGKSDVANAVALNSAVFNLTRIIGPAIAGVTIATIGLEPLFLLNAASYIAVLAALLLMRASSLMPITEKAVIERNVRSVIDRLTEGLRYTRHEPRILLAIVVLGVVSMFALNFQVVIPVYARDVLGGNADTYGFLMSAAGVGSFLSAISIAFAQRPTLRRVMFGAAGVGVGMIGLAFSRSFPLSLVLMFVTGWGMISMAASTNTIIQLTVPDILRGRVMSVFTTTFAGATPIGGLIAGTLAAIGGAPLAMLVGGVVAVLAAGVGYLRLPGGGHLGTMPVLSRRAARHR